MTKSFGLLGLALLMAGCSAQKEVPVAKQEAAPPNEEVHHEDANLEQKLRRARMGGDLDEIITRRYLRVLVVPDKLGFFFDNGQMHGAAYEGLTEFERLINQKEKGKKLPLKVLFIPVRRDQLLDMLADGRGDVAVARIADTPELRARVDATTPIFDDAKVVLVTGPSAPPVSSVEDLAGREIHVLKGAQKELAKQVNARLKQVGKPEIKAKELDENLNIDDAIEMVNAGLIPMTAAELNVGQIWSKVFPSVKVHPEIVLAEAPLVWAVRKNCPKLTAEINAFIKEHKVGTAYGSTVFRRYFKDVKWVKNAVAPGEVDKFRRMVDLFKLYGDQYKFPHLLITAQAYQESRLNQDLKSSAGAVGVMQIKPSTAAGSPINIPDVTKLENNIKAGVKYMRFLMDEYYKDEPMDPVNKGLFSIASYNAGPNKIRKLREEAKEMGLDENKWFNNVEIVVARRVGSETTQYVANIYKYYLAYKMLSEADGAGKSD